jgi:membrane-associated protein
MDSIVQFLSLHADHAHWYILLGLLLAGCNIPVSIDVLVIASALISAHFVPERTILFYAILVVGCSLSAWIAYFTGRFIGLKLTKFPIFRSLFSDKKLASMQNFYQKHKIWAFIIGRFIPFGVRNALFITSGLSKMPFLRFAVFDFIACFIWVSLSFFLFFYLGQNFDTIWTQVKMLNGCIFIAFVVAVIGSIWYKRVKQKKVDLHE